MSAQKQSGRDLEIDQDPAFQRREWAIQRVGWALMTAAIVAALIGAFGDGPVARAEAVSPDGNLRVHYDRMTRRESITAVHISIAGAGLRSGTARLWLDRKYVEDMSVRHITPQPAGVSADATRLHFTFAVDAGADSTGIHIELEPSSVGSISGAVGLNGASAVFFRQYVLP